MESKPRWDILPLIHLGNQLKIMCLQEAPESVQLSEVETLGKRLEHKLPSKGKQQSQESLVCETT